MKLYSYRRSTTFYWARAMLNLKAAAYEIMPIDLVAGDQHSAGYATLNPGKCVPTLGFGDETAVMQPMAITEHVDAHPDNQPYAKD